MDKKEGAILLPILILVIMSISIASVGLTEQEISNSHCIENVTESTASSFDMVGHPLVDEGPRSVDASQINPVKVPTSPKSLVATAGNAQVSLSWSPPANSGGVPITNYSIYRGTSPSGEVLLVTIGPLPTSYTDTGLTNGQTYYYMVTAWNSEGESASSNEASAIPATVPSEPQSLSATPGNAQIALAWTAPSSSGGRPILNYTIYRGATSGGETLLRTLGNVLAYTDTSLTNGQTYYYVVRAVNIVGKVQRQMRPSHPGHRPVGPAEPRRLLRERPGHLDMDGPHQRRRQPDHQLQDLPRDVVGRRDLVGDRRQRPHPSGFGPRQWSKLLLHPERGERRGRRDSIHRVLRDPNGRPSAPRDLTAAAGNAQITLTWNAPSSDGEAR